MCTKKDKRLHCKICLYNCGIELCFAMIYAVNSKINELKWLPIRSEPRRRFKTTYKKIRASALGF